MEVFWLFHKMSLCPTYNIEICETYFCHLRKHIQKVITVKYVHVATPLETKWYIAERQGIWIWTKPFHASPFPYITIHVHIIKNYSVLHFIIQECKQQYCKSKKMYSLLRNRKEWRSLVLFIFSYTMPVNCFWCLLSRAVCVTDSGVSRDDVIYASFLNLHE